MGMPRSEPGGGTARPPTTTAAPTTRPPGPGGGTEPGGGTARPPTTAPPTTQPPGPGGGTEPGGGTARPPTTAPPTTQPPGPGGGTEPGGGTARPPTTAPPTTRPPGPGGGTEPGGGTARPPTTAPPTTQPPGPGGGTEPGGGTARPPTTRPPGQGTEPGGGTAQPPPPKPTPPRRVFTLLPPPTPGPTPAPTPASEPSSGHPDFSPPPTSEPFRETFTPIGWGEWESTEDVSGGLQGQQDFGGYESQYYRPNPQGAWEYESQSFDLYADSTPRNPYTGELLYETGRPGDGAPSYSSLGDLLRSQSTPYGMSDMDYWGSYHNMPYQSESVPGGKHNWLGRTLKDPVLELFDYQQALDTTSAVGGLFTSVPWDIHSAAADVGTELTSKMTVAEIKKDLSAAKDISLGVAPYVMMIAPGTLPAKILIGKVARTAAGRAVGHFVSGPSGQVWMRTTKGVLTPVPKGVQVGVIKPPGKVAEAIKKVTGVTGKAANVAGTTRETLMQPITAVLKRRVGRLTDQADQMKKVYEQATIHGRPMSIREADLLTKQKSLLTHQGHVRRNLQAGVLTNPAAARQQIDVMGKQLANLRKEIALVRAQTLAGNLTTYNAGTARTLGNEATERATSLTRTQGRIGPGERIAASTGTSAGLSEVTGGDWKTGAIYGGVPAFASIGAVRVAKNLKLPGADRYLGNMAYDFGADLATTIALRQGIEGPGYSVMEGLIDTGAAFAPHLFQGLKSGARQITDPSVGRHSVSTTISDGGGTLRLDPKLFQSTVPAHVQAAEVERLLRESPLPGGTRDQYITRGKYDAPVPERGDAPEILRIRDAINEALMRGRTAVIESPRTGTKVTAEPSPIAEYYGGAGFHVSPNVKFALDPQGFDVYGGHVNPVESPMFYGPGTSALGFLEGAALGSKVSSDATAGILVSAPTDPLLDIPKLYHKGVEGEKIILPGEHLGPRRPGPRVSGDTRLYLPEELADIPYFKKHQLALQSMIQDIKGGKPAVTVESLAPKGTDPDGPRGPDAPDTPPRTGPDSDPLTPPRTGPDSDPLTPPRTDPTDTGPTDPMTPGRGGSDLDGMGKLDDPTDSITPGRGDPSADPMRERFQSVLHRQGLSERAFARNVTQQYVDDAAPGDGLAVRFPVAEARDPFGSQRTALGFADVETPPRVPPETPPRVPPETPPRVPPETPPRVPPETPPRVPPETPPRVPPETPPRVPPETPPRVPPETPPRVPPETPPRVPPETPPRVPPETPPRVPPETPPRVPPETPPRVPPETPPRVPPETPPRVPPETPPRVPPETPPRVPPETPPRVPPETPPRVPPETPPRVPPETPPRVPPETPPRVPPETPPRVPPETPPRVPPETPPRVPPETPPWVPPTTTARQRKRRLPDQEPRQVPNTGGKYPAEVEHHAEVIVTTDLDTGKQRATLVAIKGEPEVTALQGKPAGRKTIKGRTLDVEVSGEGKVDFETVDHRGPHRVVGSEARSTKSKAPRKPRPSYPKVSSGNSSKGQRSKPPWFKPPSLPGARR